MMGGGRLVLSVLRSTGRRPLAWVPGSGRETDFGPSASASLEGFRSWCPGPGLIGQHRVRSSSPGHNQNARD